MSIAHIRDFYKIYNLNENLVENVTKLRKIK